MTKQVSLELFMFGRLKDVHLTILQGSYSSQPHFADEKK